MKIGFIGLGAMGTPMARRLVEAGHQVTGCDLRPHALQALRDAGGTGVDTAAQAAQGAELIAPPLRHCTDNAAMIALAGAERLAAGLVGEANGLDAGSRPRWPLDEAAALSAPVYGGGHKGAKA